MLSPAAAAGAAVAVPHSASRTASTAVTTVAALAKGRAARRLGETDLSHKRCAPLTTGPPTRTVRAVRAGHGHHASAASHSNPIRDNTATRLSAQGDLHHGSYMIGGTGSVA